VFLSRFVHGRFTQFVAISLRLSQGERQAAALVQVILQPLQLASGLRDRSDPHARERALLVARQDPSLGGSSEEAVAAVRDLLDMIGDTCSECPPA
jgi:hypothetical protein